MQEKTIKLLDELNVSRETLLKLEIFVKMLLEENQKYNLISKTTEAEVWGRHIVDSLQLASYVDPTDNLVDLGSGGGLPGIVLAIIGMNNITLIDSKRKKTEFLKAVCVELKLPCNVVWGRVEDYIFENESVVISRAFAPLSRMMVYLEGNIIMIKKMILLKGESFQDEIDEAKKTWTFVTKFHISLTSKRSKILEISDIEHASNSNSKPKGGCR